MSRRPTAPRASNTAAALTASRLRAFQERLTDVTAAAALVLGSDVVAGELLRASAAITIVHGPAATHDERRALFVRAALARIDEAHDDEQAHAAARVVRKPRRGGR